MTTNRFSTAVAALSILLGTVVLLGSALGSEGLTTLGPGHTTMKVNTAFALCALGAALLLRRFGLRGASAGLGLLVVAIGAVTLVEYITGLGHGFDELVFADLNRAQAGRMGINTATAFCLLGAAVVLLQRKGRRRTLAAHACAIGALTIGFLAVMGYVNGVKALYGPASYTAMALSTALAVSLIALAVLASSAEYGLPAIALAPTPGGRLARRLLPIAGAPILLHAVRSRAVHADLVSPDVGAWLVGTAVVAVLVVTVLLVARATDRTEVTRALLATVVESSSEAIVTTTAKRVVTSWNRGAERLYGWPAAEAIGRPIAFLLPPGHHDDIELLGPAAAGQRIGDHETVRLHRDGSRVHIALTIWTMFDEAGAIEGYGSIAQDIGERLALEKQRESLIEVQKFESLGVLAGGIAHNFNNLLLAVLGNAGLALATLPESSPERPRLEQIEVAATRAAELARDMLAYSGEGTIIVEPVDLPALVEETGRLVSAGNAGVIEIDYRFEQGLPPIVADATQIRQAVMSLVTNAVEALGPGGGSIEIRADTVNDVPGDGFRLPDAMAPGPYVRLEVEDGGVGMDDETLANLFDPFFTTKFVGRGLGLAAVLGIVRGHGGAIRITTELGSGTVTTLLFPCAPLTEVDDGDLGSPHVSLGSSGTRVPLATAGSAGYHKRPTLEPQAL